MQHRAALRGHHSPCFETSAPTVAMEGWGSPGCLCGQRPEGNRPAVRRDELPARRLVLLLNQAGEWWQEFFSCSHPSLISPTNALAEMKSIDV